MTIICVKDGVMAADGRCCIGEFIASDSIRKIARSRDGALGAASGNFAESIRFLEWIAMTATPEQRQFPRAFEIDMPTPDDFFGTILETDGSIWEVNNKGRIFTLGETIAANGNGWEIGLGAMLAGLSAEEAVKICAKRVLGCGGDIQVEYLADSLGVAQDDAKRDVVYRNWRTKMGLA